MIFPLSTAEPSEASNSSAGVTGAVPHDEKTAEIAIKVIGFSIFLMIKGIFIFMRNFYFGAFAYTLSRVYDGSSLFIACTIVSTALRAPSEGNSPVAWLKYA